jgi:uncharacterized membrane protein
MNTNKIIKLVTAALMAAMTCVATFLLPIHVPGLSGGYIHPGDAFVLLSGIILGPLYGSIAAGIGSMLADIVVGYPYFYVTLIVKALAALVGVFVYRRFKVVPVILAAIFSGIVVTLGYFIFETGVFGLPTAIFDVPFNIIQNIFSIILSAVLLPLLRKVPQIKNMIEDRL